MFKLLIVDDEPRIRQGLCESIPWNSIGFSEVYEAGNGRTAFEKVEEVRPHLVITDIRMPDMDGLQLIEKMRDNSIHSQVIIVSGYDDFTYAQQAIRFGVCDYILKPIDETDLYDRVLNVMKKLEVAEVYTSSGKKEDSANNNIIIKEAIEYIEKHFGEDINLVSVAENIGVHPNYLSTIFTKKCGESFVKFLTRKRIEEAKKLMKDPMLKLYEISEMVGYSDYRWFAKVFKQYEGVTPKKYIS